MMMLMPTTAATQMARRKSASLGRVEALIYKLLKVKVETAVPVIARKPSTTIGCGRNGQYGKRIDILMGRSVDLSAAACVA